CVLAFCTTENLSGESSWTTVRVQSPPLEVNATSSFGSNPLASTPRPIGTVVSNLPLSELTIAITLLPQPANKRWCFWSIARPEGSSHPAIGQVLLSWPCLAS